MPDIRWSRITAELRQRIEQGELAVGERLETEIQIAARYGVSRPTANRAVQELQREGLVVRQRRVGTVVAPRRPRRTGTIALLINNVGSYPQAAYIRSIQEALPDEFRLTLWDTRSEPERERRLLQRVRDDADGVLLWPTCAPENTSHLAALRRRGQALVCLDRLPEGLDACAVLTDDDASLTPALERLWERGHRRIAYFGCDQLGVSAIRARRACVTRFLHERGEANPERWMRQIVHQPAASFCQAVADALFVLVRGDEPVTAVVCQQDSYMAAVLEACDALGLRPPTDIEIVSYADIPPETGRVSQQVHRIVQCAEALGAEAVRLLLHHDAHPGAPTSVVRLPADFLPAEEGAPTGSGSASAPR